MSTGDDDSRRTRELCRFTFNSQSSDITYVGANDGLQQSIEASFRGVLVPGDYLGLNSFLFELRGRDR